MTTPWRDTSAAASPHLEGLSVYVKVDLAYRVAYLVNDQDEALQAQSEVTRSTVDPVLARWGYARTRDGKWETTDILNAIDAVRFPVEPTKSKVSSAH